MLFGVSFEIARNSFYSEQVAPNKIIQSNLLRIKVIRSRKSYSESISFAVYVYEWNGMKVTIWIQRDEKRKQGNEEEKHTKGQEAKPRERGIVFAYE